MVNEVIAEYPIQISSSGGFRERIRYAELIVVYHQTISAAVLEGGSGPEESGDGGDGGDDGLVGGGSNAGGEGGALVSESMGGLDHGEHPSEIPQPLASSLALSQLRRSTQ